MTHPRREARARSIFSLLVAMLPLWISALIYSGCDSDESFCARIGWRPSSRPDRYFPVSFSHLGCRQEAIDFSYAGEIMGFTCRWSRDEPRGFTIREECYFRNGKFFLAHEEGYRDGRRAWRARLFFRNSGDAYYRVGEARQPAGNLVYFLDYVDRGILVSRYEADWDGFSINNNSIWNVPYDYRRTVGVSLPEVDNRIRYWDQAKLDSLEQQGVDLTEPQAIEYGFYFGQPGEKSPGWQELARAGCRWRSKNDRGGRVGPFPEHCTMDVLLSLENLHKTRAAFVDLAKRHNGRFYGWTGSVR